MRRWVKGLVIVGGLLSFTILLHTLVEKVTKKKKCTSCEDECFEYSDMDCCECQDNHKDY